MNIKEYTATNLIFLRASISVSIEDLAERLGVDPIDIYSIEKGGNSFGTQQPELTNVLCMVGMYFTVPLEDIFFTDLRYSNIYSFDISKMIIGEVAGTPFSRNDFREYTLRDAKDYSLSDEESEENKILVLRENLRATHKLFCMEEKYFYLRIKGDIQKSTFFEPE